MLLIPLSCLAQQPFLQPTPPDMFGKFLVWSVKGSHANESLGASGLDTLGRLSDSVPFAIAAGGDGGSSLMYNRFPEDTARQYKFPGTKVIRCELRKDTLPDFVVYDHAGQKIIVLAGTDTINKFDTLAVLHGSGEQFLGLQDRIVVADVDSSGYQSIIVFDNFSDQLGDTARVLWYKGGPVFDTVPIIVPHGRHGTGELAIGKMKNEIQPYLCESHWINNDTTIVYLYPFNKSFDIILADSIICTIDTTRYSNLGDQGGFALIDVDGDGIDDILLEGYDNNYDPALKADKAVFVYKGGSTISPYPTYYFHRPFQTTSAQFGAKIVDVGDITGRGYHTIVISDPDASVGGDENGAIMLYNIGKNVLKDSCVAYAEGQNTFLGAFGSAVIPVPDVDGKGHNGFMVGADDDSISLNGYDHGGALYVFRGDTTLGPVSVRETADAPEGILLSQNYPNPATEETTIAWRIASPALAGKNVTVSIYNMLGRETERIYTGHADDVGRIANVDLTALPAGAYMYSLHCGDYTVHRMMNIIK